MALLLYRPVRYAPGFRQELPADAETAACNHACGGTIDFLPEQREA